MTHLTEEELILAYYNEPGAEAHAQPHLATCAECRAAAESLSRALSVCNEWTVPERGPEFGRDAWLRLVPGLAAQPQEGRGWRDWLNMRPVQILISTMAVAVLLMAVFFAGRYSRRAEAPVMAGLSDKTRERILAIAVADHLERVHNLMTEIANTTGSGPGALTVDKARAADLVQECRLVRQSLAAKGESSTTNVLDEVERFLIETSHTPDNVSATELLDLRERIESGSLLFKVKIVESNLRHEEQTL